LTKGGSGVVGAITQIDMMGCSLVNDCSQHFKQVQRKTRAILWLCRWWLTLVLSLFPSTCLQFFSFLFFERISSGAPSQVKDTLASKPAIHHG